MLPITLAEFSISPYVSWKQREGSTCSFVPSSIMRLICMRSEMKKEREEEEEEEGGRGEEKEKRKEKWERKKETWQENSF